MASQNMYQKVDPVHNDIARILKAPAEVISALCEDAENLKLINNLKEVVQKNTRNKKREDDIFFAAMDISAFLKHTKLSVLFNARKEEILRALEIDAKKLSENLRKEEAYLQAEAATQKQKEQQLSTELLQARSLLETALGYETELESVISQFNTLQQTVNDWEAQQWRPAVTAAGKIAAAGISSQFAIDLASDPQHQSLRAAVGDEGRAELDRAKETFDAFLANEYSSIPSPARIAQVVPGLEQPQLLRPVALQIKLMGGFNRYEDDKKDIVNRHHPDKEIALSLNKPMSVRELVALLNKQVYVKHIQEVNNTCNIVNNAQTENLKNLHDLAEKAVDIRDKLNPILKELSNLTLNLSEPEPEYVRGLKR